MLDRFLFVWLSGLSLLAYFWPRLLPGVFDPFEASTHIFRWLIAVTMFSVGSLMRRDEFREVLRDWRSVVAGTVIQYVATPLLAWGFGHLCGLSGGHLIGVIIVGCVPGAMASNVLTMLAGGNVSYSVSLTTVSTIISPIVVPIAMYLCLRNSLPVNLGDVALELILIVVGPVAIGRLICTRWNKLERIMERVAPILAPITILMIISGVVGANRARLGQGVAPVVTALAGINLVGFLVGYWGGAALRFSEGVRRALTIEIGMQNAGLGVALAAKLFPDLPDAQVPPALFTFGSMLTATLLVQAWIWRDGTQRTMPNSH